MWDRFRLAAGGLPERMNVDGLPPSGPGVVRVRRNKIVVVSIGQDTVDTWDNPAFQLDATTIVLACLNGLAGIIFAVRACSGIEGQHRRSEDRAAS
jgi:hypothetical protein